MQFKGIVTLQALDAETFAPISEVVENNIITEAFGRRCFPAWELDQPLLDLDIVIYDAVLEPSLYPPTNTYPSSNGFTRTTRSGDVFGVARREFIEGSGVNPDIIQYSARFSPPAAGQVRNITSIALNRSNDAYIPAFTKLATPCVQTDSQIYDVYYRILVTYDENSIIDKKSMRLMIKRSSLQTGYSFYGGFIDEGYINPLPPLVINQSDKNSIFKDDHSSHNLLDQTSSTSINSKRLPYQTKTYQYGFDDGVGLIMRSHVFGISPSWPATYKAKDLFENKSKIQNVFGYKLESTNLNSHPFLDVDNLATGSGNITLSGDWQDEEYTANKNLYFRTAFPERNTVKITKSGAVGVAEYKYVKEKYITTSPTGGWKTNYGIISKNTAVNITVDGLISNQSLTAGDFHNPPRSLIGDVGEVQFGIEQVSASIAFDDSAVLICKSNRVILYSLGSSRYWNITGAFTNIHQVAVLNGVVYIACRNTGLYSANPRVNLTAQLVPVVGYRTADFTNCNGVCVGYNNKLWAVGKDALASYDGTSWIVYDNTTTPQFSTNTTTYARVEYIKAVDDGAGDQIFFVYRHTDATAKIGFWWSPSTSIVETNDWAKSGSWTLGYPRRHRQHVKVTLGAVYVWQNNTISKVAFNTSAFVTINSSFNDTVYGFNIINNKINGQRNLAIYETGSGVSGTTGAYFINVRTRVYDNTNVVVQDIQTNNCDYGTSLSQSIYRTLLSMDVGTTSYAHKTVIDVNGIWLHLQKTSSLLFHAVIGKAPYLERHQQGGPLAYMCRDTYGWNGSAWVLDHADSKVTHSTPQALLDGVNIAFNEGATGTSFVIGNHYKFGLCRGLLKDNATRCKYIIPEILVKSLSGVVPLTSNTVPALVALPTGVVGMHAVHKSRNAFVNSVGNVVFPGNTDGQFAAGDKQVTGDFHLQISPFNGLVAVTYTVGTSPRGITYDPTSNAVWVTNYGSNNVSKLNANTGALIGTYTVGSNPYNITYDPTSNAVWVTNYGSNNVTKLNAATGALIGTYTVGSNPTGITYDPINNVVWVANSGSNNVTKLNAATGALIGTYTVGTTPEDVVYDHTNNAVWVTNWDSNNVTKLNAATGALIGTYTVGSRPYDITYDPTNNAVWVANRDSNNVTKLNAATGALIGTYAVGTTPRGITYDSTSNVVRVVNTGSNNITKLNAATGALIGTYAAGTSPYGIAYDHTNNAVWVTNYSTNNVFKINANSDTEKKAIALSNSINRTIVGIGKRHKGGVPIVGIVVTSETTAEVHVSTVAPFDTSTGRSNPYNFSGLNSSSVLGIKRVGNIITITLNGANVYTVNTSGVITASDRRLDVMFATHYWGIGNAFRSANSTCPVVTIASNGEDNAVMFGNEVSGTEAFDIRCKGVVFELGAKGKLNGVDAVVKFNGTYPVPGEISVDAESLIATFNTADVGKTIEIDCTRVWDM